MEEQKEKETLEEEGEANADTLTAPLNVKLASFEGPMDLLMHLIDKNKIDIYDIPIASLTEQYLAYLQRMKDFNLEIASSFIVMAATLLAIKTRMMLPKQQEEKEALIEEDPREELVRRILEYRRYQKTAEILTEMASLAGRFVSRPPLDLPVTHVPPDNIPLSALLAAFQMVMEVKEELKIPDALVSPEEYRIEDKMEELTARLRQTKGRIRFSEIFHGGNRTELIVTFLAMLELIKVRAIRVKQGATFGEIYIDARGEEDVGGNSEQTRDGS